jgi:hypothetical protein
MQELSSHYTNEVRVEKQLHYERRGEGSTSLRDADGCLSLILDGEDQNETTFPHQPRVPENVEKCQRCKLKVEGVLVHGLILLLYLIPPWLGSGAAMACTVLLHTLWVCKLRLGNLPRKLYIQSDNGSENKNKVTHRSHSLCCSLNDMCRLSCMFCAALCISKFSRRWSGACCHLVTHMRILMLGSASLPVGW